MTANLPAIDPRTRVRLWDFDYRTVLFDERTQPGQLASELMEQGLKELDRHAAAATIHSQHQILWSGYVYLDGRDRIQIPTTHKLTVYPRPVRCVQCRCDIPSSDVVSLLLQDLESEVLCEECQWMKDNSRSRPCPKS